MLWYDPMYRKMYIPTHTNFGSYLAGLIAGLLYHRLKRANFDAVRHRVRERRRKKKKEFKMV